MYRTGFLTDWQRAIHAQSEYNKDYHYSATNIAQSLKEEGWGQPGYEFVPHRMREPYRRTSLSPAIKRKSVAPRSFSPRTGRSSHLPSSRTSSNYGSPASYRNASLESEVRANLQSLRVQACKNV